MVDLVGQYERLKEEVDRAMQKVITSAKFINGPDVKEFEEQLADYLGVKDVITCGNGTDALQISLMALNLPGGSEVIVPDFTFVASVEVIKLLGLQPVLVDVDPGTFNLDPAKVEKAITAQTRAILPVHLFGQCADMDALQKIAKKHNLYLIEDAAQALGTSYTFENGVSGKAGTLGSIGCTSFFPSKNLGCMGDGGAIFTNDESLGRELRLIKNHGMNKQYKYSRIGVNSRLDTIQAAVLGVKLQYLDEFNNNRRQAANRYDEAFSGNPGIQTPERWMNSSHIFHQYTIKVLNGKRDELKQYLGENGIASKVYYPDALHQHEVYRDCLRDEREVAHSMELKNQVLSLPMHTELQEKQINTITQKVNQFFN